MLEEYIPANAPDYYLGEHASYATPNPFDYIEDNIDPDMATGSFAFLPGSYYKPIEGTVERPAVLAGKTVIDQIRWAGLDFPDNPEYERTAHHDRTDRPYIKLYSRIRGILGHSLLLRDGIDFDEAIRRAVEDIDEIPNNLSYQEFYDVISDWSGAPRVKPAEEECVYDVPRSALKQRLKDDAHEIAQNWERINADLRLRQLADEVITIGETDSGHGYGCKIDRLGYVEDDDASLRPGLYVGEVKICEEWHPAHLLQAEAYRRSLIPDLGAEPIGLVVRIGAERGDYTVLTSDDDQWDQEVLWGLFKKKARWMYENENSPYSLALEHADTR